MYETFEFTNLILSLSYFIFLFKILIFIKHLDVRRKPFLEKTLVGVQKTKRGKTFQGQENIPGTYNAFNDF